MNEGTITGAIPKTRCQRCGQPTYLYGIHTCSPQAPQQKDVNELHHIPSRRTEVYPVVPNN